MQTTFKKGHKFDLFDMFTITPNEVQELFWKEFESKVDKKKPNLDNLKVILESGLVDVNAKRNDDSTPLHLAAWENSLEIAQLLISSGAEVNAKDNSGETPLHWAVGNIRLELIQLLISSGADVNAKRNDGETPLHSAARRNYLAFAQLLISSGADLEAKDNYGLTPLALAASWGCQEMMELLKSKK